MPLESLNTIDAVMRSPSGVLILLITDSGITTDPDERFAALMGKLATYGRYVMSDEFSEKYPGLGPSDVQILVACMNDPTPEMAQVKQTIPDGDPSHAMKVSFERTPAEAFTGKSAKRISSAVEASFLINDCISGKVNEDPRPIYDELVSMVGNNFDRFSMRRLLVESTYQLITFELSSGNASGARKLYDRLRVICTKYPDPDRLRSFYSLAACSLAKHYTSHSNPSAAYDIHQGLLSFASKQCPSKDERAILYEVTLNLMAYLVKAGDLRFARKLYDQTVKSMTKHAGDAQTREMFANGAALLLLGYRESRDTIEADRVFDRVAKLADSHADHSWLADRVAECRIIFLSACVLAEDSDRTTTLVPDVASTLRNPKIRAFFDEIFGNGASERFLWENTP